MVCGKPSRMTREKFGSLSAARARSLIRLRCLSSLNGNPRGGDGVILIKHFVRLSIQENAPIPWSTNLAARWVRMLVVQLLVMALYHRGFSCRALMVFMYSRNLSRACAGEASVR